MRMRPVPAPKKPKFEKPTEEDMRESLVRLDRIEVWGARAYVFQALPGYARWVQQGVIGLFRDRRVVYMATSGFVGGRQKTSWWGHIDDLGRPLPAPRVFRAAKVMRVQRVSSRSFMISMHGKLRIVCFTGLPADRNLPKALAAGKVVLENVPKIGDFVQVADIGVTRAHGALYSKEGVAAAAVWRSVLDGNVMPETLPLWAETRNQAHRTRRSHQHGDTS